MTIWHFDQKQIPGKRSSELTLSWRLPGDAITDGYTVEDISASALWPMWRQRYAERTSSRSTGVFTGTESPSLPRSSPTRWERRPEPDQVPRRLF